MYITHCIIVERKNKNKKKEELAVPIVERKKQKQKEEELAVPIVERKNKNKKRNLQFH